MKVIFTRSHDLSSAFIRLVQGLRSGHFVLAPYSHCAIMCADGENIIDAYWSNHGVTKRPYVDFQKQFPYHVVVDTGTEPYEADALAWLETQRGKAYDWKGLFGFVVGWNTQSPSKWYCFELAAEVARRAGIPVPSEDRVDCLKLLKWLGRPQQ